MLIRRLFAGSIAATLVVSALAAPAAADSEKRWTRNGIRHMEITTQTTTRKTVNGRSGSETSVDTYSYVNALDMVRQALSCSGLSPSTNDEWALVDGIKSGATTQAGLRDAVCGPAGIPGVSALPAGFHGHDRSSWNQLGFDTTDYTARFNAASAALGQTFSGNSMGEAQAFVNRMISEGKLGNWEFRTIFDAVGWDFDFGSYTSPQDTYLKGIVGAGAPHFVPIIADRPGAPLQAIYHDFGERGNVATTNDAKTYVAVAYFLSEAQRWLSARNLLSSLGAGGLANQAFDRARDDAGILSATGDPLVLDLNRNKFADATGRSTSAIRTKKNMGFVEAGSVFFDLWGYGPLKTEWIRNGDAFLAEATRIRAALQTKRNLNGRDLFGDAEGYPGGFLKLAMFDKNRDGKISGVELDALGVWIDQNRDGELQEGEFRTLKEVDVTEIGAKPRIIYNKDYEPLEVAYFIQGGKKHLMQEVWFALESKSVAKGGR
ncbi:MAG: hypothetical protein FJZ01_16705 [Candidatus Sericytochromatia bacterium]|nr:hypothetical protein [Candidatus Tanganyikabacteria bacterium]